MSILWASFDFQPSIVKEAMGREISPHLIVKRISVIKSAYTLLPGGTDVLSLLMG